MCYYNSIKRDKVMDREIEELVEGLCERHLTGLDYEIIYSDRHTRYLGRCRTVKRNLYTTAYKLFFSVPYFTHCCENGDITEIKDVVLHEIAHALTHSAFGGNHKHDNYWRKMAEEIGAKPERCATTEYKPYKHLYKCPCCGRLVKKLRKMKKDTACGQCCRKYNNGKWSEKYILELVETRGKAGF